MSDSLPAGVVTFDVAADRAATARTEGLTQAPQQMDDASRVAAQTLTSQENPWTQAPQPAATAPVVVPDAAQAPQPDAEAHYKKIIGDQGNQIGDLRKLVDALLKRVQQPAQQPIAAQLAQTAAVNLFRNLQPGDYPTAQQVNEALLTAGQALEQAFAARVEEVTVQSQFQAAGASAEETALIRLEYPNLTYLPAQERAGLIAALLRNKRAETAAPVAQAVQTAQAGVRQQVYIAPPQPITSIPQQGAMINIDAYGQLKDASQMEKALRSIGIGRVDDSHRRG